MSVVYSEIVIIAALPRSNISEEPLFIFVYLAF